MRVYETKGQYKLERHDFSDHVRVARVGKPHGIRGEVTAEVFTDSPETRFVKGTVLDAKSSHADLPSALNRLTLEGARWNKKILLLKFLEISDRNAAEAIRNTELFVSMDTPEDADGWYAEDLIGLTVHEQQLDMPKVGEVTDLITGDAQDRLEIQLVDGSRVLIPFVEEIVPEIHMAQGAIVITPPPGLLELNQ